jgi:hypothetical protein
MKDFELSVPKGLLDETASKRKEETDAKVFIYILMCCLV